MKDFSELVTVIENNDNCVLMKVKDGIHMDMIKTGYLDGDEDMIRWHKDRDDTITVFRKDGKHYSWSRGTLCSEPMNILRRVIRNYILSLK